MAISSRTSPSTYLQISVDGSLYGWPHTGVYSNKYAYVSLDRPQALRSFQSCTRKEGGPGKTYHMRDVRWNQLPYMVQQQVGWLKRWTLSPKVRVLQSEFTISYESASGCLCVKNCDLQLDRDKFYQAPLLFSCNVEKIGEPGDETMHVWLMQLYYITPCSL